MFPTPRLGRYLIRTGFDFLIFDFDFLLVFVLGCCLSSYFCCWANFFFIAFKNINNIVKGGKMQFY